MKLWEYIILDLNRGKPSKHKKSKSFRLNNLTIFGHEFDFLSQVWFWSKMTFQIDIYRRHVSYSLTVRLSQ